MKRIHLCLAHMGGAEQKYIQEAFDTDWVVPLGPNVNAFEKDLEDYLSGNESDSCHVAALSSGTAAIHLALVLLGVGRGDEVICQSFTFAASANPIVYQGATPVFVDSEPDSWNMSPTLMEEAIRDRIKVTGKTPKAIVVAHLYGMPADMDAINEVAHRYGIPVVEDAAEALGSRYKGRMCGTLGDFGTLSFNGNKMITTSGGGALVCHSEEAKARALYYATQAREPLPYYHHLNIGYNYRLSNICAGIGRGQMEVLGQHLDHHRSIHSRYAAALDGRNGITVHSNPSPDYDANYWLVTILLDNPDALRIALDEAGIESRLLWKPLHLQPVFAGAPRYVNGVSESLFNRGLCLPSGPRVGNEEFEYILDTINYRIKVITTTQQNWCH